MIGIRRKFHLIASVEADDREQLASHLRMLANDIELETIHHGPSMLGGYSSGHVVHLKIDDNMTHDNYFTAIEQELSKIIKCKVTGEVCTDDRCSKTWCQRDEHYP